VLEEAANEGVHRQRQAPGLPGARVGVAEGDMAMVEAFDAVVGEGDAVDVAGEIEGGVGAGADRLDVDRPAPLPYGGIAMIFGMLPLALAIGEGAEQRAPMAHAVIGGLVTSTLLTLFVVPVFYTLLDDLVVRVLGKKRVKAAEPTHAYGD